MISAIIVAAGSSSRMGFDKLNADLGGISVLARSILAFQNCPDVSEIRVITANEKQDDVAQLAAEIGADKFREAIAGGAERHLSVWNGIQRIDVSASGLIAVHDGARPLVTPSAISACGKIAEESGGATLAHRVTNTLKRATENGEVSESVSRNDLWAMETPQIFNSKLLRKAYVEIMDRGQLITDEVSALQEIGVKVQVVENREPNIKITVPADLLVAEKILESRKLI